MAWKDTLLKTVEWPAKFLANSGHAQQDIPGQHRLLNAGGMFLAWWMGDKLRDVIFGVTMKSEGEYVAVKKEDVPAPLQFLHKAIDWDPHSETPDNQWKKLAYQLIPGVGAGIGSTLGSIYAFQRNKREQKYHELKGLAKLNLLDVDYTAQYAQSTPLRLLAAFFGTFSAASGLTFLYGFFLNPAFATANGAKVFSRRLSQGNAAPHKAVLAEMETVGAYIEEAVKTGKVREGWAEQFTERVLQPLFGHELESPEAQAKAVKTLQAIVEESYQKFRASGKPAKEIREAVAKDLSTKLTGKGFDETVTKRLHLDIAKATPGNANPVFRQFQDYLASLGLATKFGLKGAIKKDTPLKYLVPAGAAAGIAIAASPRELHAAEPQHTPAMPSGTADTSAAQPAAEELAALVKHPHPDTKDKTPEEYVKAAVEMHSAQYGKSGPPGWLKWMGEGQLAVLPINRMSCAVGLTTGLMIAGNMAKIATGYALDGKKLDPASVPTWFKGLTGIVKDYNPHGLRPRDRWIKYGQWAVYSLGGLLGVKAGTEFAYRNVKEKNKDPHYLEDFLPRVSMHQGGAWSWLAAGSAIFGSASGLWTLPIPGLNYGVGLAARATSMQDRNFMLGGGLNKLLSGATTTSFLRLREGMNYLCHYAASNPAENPVQIEYLAYTTLGPIFKDKLTVGHIQEFTKAVHAVRDQFWQEGGIPKEKHEEALQTMREVFTGPGLEVLLINMGLNPGTVDFEKMYGLTGTISNKLGVSEKVKAEQKHYDTMLTEHIAKYVDQGLITKERAEWVKAGIEARKHGQQQPALPADEAQPSEAPGLSASAQAPQAETKFADREKRKSSIKQLIDKADDPGDWRDAAKLRKEDPPLALGA